LTSDIIRYIPVADPGVAPDPVWAEADHMLTAKKVEREKKSGRYHDGHGLYLQIKNANNKSWLLRFERGGRERWLGLGPTHIYSLKQAREKARDARALLHEGIDPIDHRKAQRAALAAASATTLTFREATERYVAQHEASWTSAKHAAQYVTSLRQYAWPILGALDVAAIGVPHVLRVLEQKVEASKGYPAGTFWTARTTTADRVRNRIESILDWAAARGHRPKGANPAAWSGNLEHTLPAPSKVARVTHHAAMPYAEIPVLMAELRKREGVGAKALMFLIMTAARAGEALSAKWDEIDLAEKVWVIPAERMKSRKEHRVLLAPQAIELLQRLYTEEGNPFLFIGARRASASPEVMVQTLRRLGHGDITVHGFRSAFSDWAHEQTAHSNHTIELSLAHAVGSEVERAYRRSDMAQKRRRLLEDWAKFCTSPAVQKAKRAIVPIRGRS
jgi:integrase